VDICHIARESNPDANADSSYNATVVGDVADDDDDDADDDCDTMVKEVTSSHDVPSPSCKSLTTEVSVCLSLLPSIILLNDDDAIPPTTDAEDDDVNDQVKSPP